MDAMNFKKDHRKKRELQITGGRWRILPFTAVQKRNTKFVARMVKNKHAGPWNGLRLGFFTTSFPQVVVYEYV